MPTNNKSTWTNYASPTKNQHTVQEVVTHTVQGITWTEGEDFNSLKYVALSSYDLYNNTTFRVKYYDHTQNAQVFSYDTYRALDQIDRHLALDYYHASDENTRDGLRVY